MLTDGEDFQILSGFLSFVPSLGDQRRCGCIEILQDGITEGPETFNVQLLTIFASENIVLVDAEATVTIEDDDGGMRK